VVEAAIRFGGNGISYMERLGVATKATAIREAELRGQITAQEAAYLRLQNRITGVEKARLAAFSAVSGGVALAGAGVLAYSVTQAANMERAMLNLQIATHSSRKTMDAFRDSVYQTAFATAQSAPDIAAIYGAIASTSGLPASSLTPRFLSTVTKFGEIVQMKSAGTQHEYTALEAATQLIELAHQYRAYTPQQIGTFAEMLHKATYFMPGGMSQFLTQSKYFTPLLALSAGNVDAMRQSVLLGILLQQTGLGRGRGGTGVAAFERQIIQGLAMTSHAQSGRREALLKMGLIDEHGNTPFVRTNAQNQTYFDVIGALRQVQKYAESQTQGLTGTARSHAEEIFLRNAFSALGIQGSLVGLVAAGGGNQQMMNVLKRMEKIPSIAQDQAMRLNTFWGALQRDSRGIGSLGAALAGPEIKNLTPVLQRFGNALYHATMNLERHPATASGIFRGIEIGTGIAAIGAGAKIIVPALKFIGGGLLDIGKFAVSTGKTIDNIFLRGVGQEMLGTIRDVGRAATEASPALRLLGGIIAKLASLANLPSDILTAFNNASAEGNAPVVPDPNAPYGSKAWMAYQNLMRTGHALGASPKAVHAFDRATHITIQNVHLPHVTNAREFVNELSDPRSPLYNSGGTRTSKGLPRPLTTKPR